MSDMLKVNIGANTREFVAGVDDMQTALEGVSDSLHDAEGDGDKFERNVSDNMRDVADQADRTGRAIGDDIRDGARKAGDGMNTFKDESKQSLRETAASIKDVGDGMDAVQEIAANAFIGFGPAGVAAGLAAAAGLGLVSGVIEDQQRAADQLREHFASAYQAATEEGRNYLDQAQIIALASDILFDTAPGGKRDQAAQDAKAIGIDLQTMVLALAGDREALTTAIEAGAAAEAAARKETEGMVGAQGEALEAYNSRLTAAVATNGELANQKTLMDANTEAANAVLALQGKTTTEVDLTNAALGRTPKTVSTTLKVDRSELDNALQVETKRVEIYTTKNGQRFF